MVQDLGPWFGSKEVGGWVAVRLHGLGFKAQGCTLEGARGGAYQHSRHLFMRRSHPPIVQVAAKGAAAPLL